MSPWKLRIIIKDSIYEHGLRSNVNKKRRTDGFFIYNNAITFLFVTYDIHISVESIRQVRDHR